MSLRFLGSIVNKKTSIDWNAGATSFSSYGPKIVRRIAFNRLPKGIRDAGISKIERKLTV